MPFNTHIGDITTFKGGAVVNSLGTNVTSYGKICRTILKAADDKNIEFAIANLGKPKPLDYIITEAGKLNCDYIIHIVVPYKSNDPNNDSLLDCYRKALDIAIKKGIKSIAIPLIGTGRNGYSKDESSRALLKACREIDKKESAEDKEILDMNQYIYLSKKGAYRNNYQHERELEIDMNNNEAVSALENNNSLFNCCKLFSYVNPEDSINTHFMEFRVKPKSNPASTYQFLEFTIERKGLEIEELISPICDSDARKKFKRTQQLKNKDLIQLAFLCKLTRTETLELMAYNGTCFSPKSRIDMALKECLEKWDFIINKNIEDLRNMVDDLADCEIDFVSNEDYVDDIDKGWLRENERQQIRADYEKKIKEEHVL